LGGDNATAIVLVITGTAVSPFLIQDGAMLPRGAGKQGIAVKNQISPGFGL
jgi:hypothetical protein